MAHIHDLIDLVVSVFIVHPTEPRVLLIHHKKLDTWLPVGGHVELHETPDKALCREVREETGLIVDDNVIIQQSPVSLSRLRKWSSFDPARNHNSEALWQPWAVEIHDFPPVPGHRHLALVYFAESLTDKVVLEKDAHNDIRWVSREELVNNENCLDTVRTYGIIAIRSQYSDWSCSRDLRKNKR